MAAFPYEDAGAGLLVPFPGLFPGSLSLRLACRVRARVSSWYRATPGVALRFFPSSPKRSASTAGRLSPTGFPVGSTLCVHRPRHWRRLGPLSAGRLSTAEAIDSEAEASISSLAIESRSATFSCSLNSAQNRLSNDPKTSAIFLKWIDKSAQCSRRGICAIHGLGLLILLPVSDGRQLSFCRIGAQ